MPDTNALAEAGAKLANPLGSLWALNFDIHPLQFFNGTEVEDGPKYGVGVNFQPIMPIPLYGTGDNQAKLVTRPVVPIVFSQPVPTSGGDTRQVGGIGDIQLPVLYSPPETVTGSNLIIGAGPVALLPTATDDVLGEDQWGLGPAVVLGYKNKLFTAALFPNYFWKVASAGQGRKPDLNRGSLLYVLTFNLPDAWQIGMNPTITYDHTASEGNRWTVPVGLFVGKTVRMGGSPVNIKAGFEYSVVKPDDFGQQAMFRIQLTPVIDSLIKEPLFGN
ncbi:hypothetical protein [Pseudodesulfovibrio mercurii]|uniref:hypothetical protein n=1 Tax=Pseudodesulfovibrio mercurii TaxID=641491 RepID=UPI0003196673|nr:hypothetical protein [Pseudodesulfovibrio mercurii]